MPVTFDFGNTGFNVGTVASGPNTVANTADGVTFTFSSDAPGEIERIEFGNMFVSQPFRVDDNGDGNDVFTLRFQSTAATMVRTLSGTTANPIQLDWNAGGLGSFRLAALTTGDGTFGTTTVTADNSANAQWVHSAINGIRFTSIGAGLDVMIGTSLTANAFSCFCAGTAIATPDGEKPVETLQPGDILCRVDGGRTRVRWLGRQQVRPGLVAASPIRIAAGALGGGLPYRDLFLSPDHALCLGGALVNAGALVNGETIRQDRRAAPFTYYHVETETHELILAEGAPAETYLEHLAPQPFDNADERGSRVVTEMGLPRVTSARLLPARHGLIRA